MIFWYGQRMCSIKSMEWYIVHGLVGLVEALVVYPCSL